MATSPRTVSELAELAGVSVRTLHYYDQIGLLTPGRRSPAGYRLYDRDDLQRLQQVLFWRALGFALEEVGRILDDPEFDRVMALTRQRSLLEERAAQLAGMLTAADEALNEEKGGPIVADDKMFTHVDDPEHAREAERRWGETDAWRQSSRRTRSWTEADKRRLVEQGTAHARRMAEAMSRGAASDSREATDLAEEARLGIDRDLYDCSRQMHVNLGEMYVADARFAEYYERHAPGLATWFRDAIVANAARP